MIKVLYIHHGSGKGGAFFSLVQSLNGIDKSLYEIIVACDYSNPMSKSFFENNGISPINIPIAQFKHYTHWWPLYTLRGISNFFIWLVLKQRVSEATLLKILNIVNPDIVHLNSVTIAPLAPIIKNEHIPVVLHVRESVNRGTFGLRRSWLRNIAKRSVDHIIYISVDGQERLTGKIPCSSVIYNPISFRKFDKTLDYVRHRINFNIPKNAKVILFPGGSNLVIKGIFPFIQAMRIICNQRNDVYAIIPGLFDDSHPKNRIENLIEKKVKDLGLYSTIIPLPFTSDVEQYYAASDIIVAPFVKPHFSRAVIEAGAMAKPIVASKIGGIVEIVDNMKTGYLVKPGDINDLSFKLIDLIKNPEKANKMGLAGYDKVKNICDIKKHGQLIMKIYSEIIISNKSQKLKVIEDIKP